MAAGAVAVPLVAGLVGVGVPVTDPLGVGVGVPVADPLGVGVGVAVAPPDGADVVTAGFGVGVQATAGSAGAARRIVALARRPRPARS